MSERSSPPTADSDSVDVEDAAAAAKRARRERLRASREKRRNASNRIASLRASRSKGIAASKEVLRKLEEEHSADGNGKHDQAIDSPQEDASTAGMGEVDRSTSKDDVDGGDDVDSFPPASKEDGAISSPPTLDDSSPSSSTTTPTTTLPHSSPSAGEKDGSPSEEPNIGLLGHPSSSSSSRSATIDGSSRGLLSTASGGERRSKNSDDGVGAEISRGGGVPSSPASSSPMMDLFVPFAFGLLVSFCSRYTSCGFGIGVCGWLHMLSLPWLLVVLEMSRWTVYTATHWSQMGDTALADTLRCWFNLCLRAVQWAMGEIDSVLPVIGALTSFGMAYYRLVGAVSAFMRGFFQRVFIFAFVVLIAYEAWPMAVMPVDGPEGIIMDHVGGARAEL